MRAAVAVTQAVAAAVTLAACGSSDGEDPDTRSATVYEAIIADVVQREFEPSEDSTPVVYALPDGPEPIGADVQAQVANAMKDDVDVRFADTRADVVDDSEPSEPLKDDSAVLVLLGTVPQRGRRIEVPVQVYRSQFDQQAIVVTLMRTGDRWAVRSTVPA
jgi:hypothetical protein